MTTGLAGDALLRIEKLQISTGRGPRQWSPVRSASLEVAPGEIVGIVGESGAGKSLTCRSVLQILPPGLTVTDGRLVFDGRDVTNLRGRELRQLRSSSVGMVFQDPYSSLNPAYTVGSQLSEVLRVSAGLGGRAAHRQAIGLLERVEIADAERRFHAYPDELSGGMRQRVMIAMAIAPQPKLLIADEATTALDTTTQASILKLLRELRDRTGMAVLMVSHDFGVIGSVCERVVAMYGGYTVELGPTPTVYQTPGHPYTAGLLASRPRLESAGSPTKRQGIPGQPPAPGEVIDGCPFRPRCGFERAECQSVEMTLTAVAEGHRTACPFVDPTVLEASPLEIGLPE